MKVLTDEGFLQKLKNFVLWQVFQKRKGKYIIFAKYKLNDNQSYVVGRVCAELSLRHIGIQTKYKDGIRDIVDEIIKQEEQLIHGIKKNTNKQ